MVSPQAGGGRRALLKAGGSDEAGVFSLFVPSLPLLLLMPSLEETECWKFLLIMCVEGAACRGAGAMGVAEGPGGVGVGRAAACPGVGSGLMADAGDAACQPVLSATAALCVGDGSYTAGFQTITLNICKQIKKQNHPVRMETSAFLSLSALSPLHLPSRVSEEVGEGGQRAQCTVVVGGFLTLSQRDHENTLSAFFQARMNRFQFFFHIYNTLNYLIHKTFIFPPVKYLFNLTL